MTASTDTDHGPPPTSDRPQCSDCGAFNKWVDKYDEIKARHDDALEKGIDPVENGVPPGPWGYWDCPQCSSE